jgi:hypothetical protein
MTPDELQKTWQSQQPSQQITVDADVLLREVRRNYQHFRSDIFWRDIREMVGAMVVIPAILVCSRMFWPFSPWPLYLFTASIAFGVVFLLVDRWRQRRVMPSAGDTLLAWAENSLAEWEHQLWLVGNVFWWYLLAPAVTLTAFYVYLGWEFRELPYGLLVAAAMWVGSAYVFFGVCRLNLRWVAGEGQARRNELRGLIDSLRAGISDPEARQARAPGWKIRCLTCGLTEDWGKFGFRRAAVGKSYTIGWCSRCRRIRCHVIERLPRRGDE